MSNKKHIFNSFLDTDHYYIASCINQNPYIKIQKSNKGKGGDMNKMPELKCGMYVNIYDDDRIFVIDYIHANGDIGIIDISSINDDRYYTIQTGKITAVYEPYQWPSKPDSAFITINLSTLWRCSIREMTVSDISKELGYDIIIIKE